MVVLRLQGITRVALLRRAASDCDDKLMRYVGVVMANLLIRTCIMSLLLLRRAFDCVWLPSVFVIGDRM